MKTPQSVPGILLAALVCFLSLPAHLTAQNLIVNGSFENISNTFVADGNDVMSLTNGSTAIPGWTVTNASLIWANNNNVFGPTTPYGLYFLDLTGYEDSFPYAGVTQNIPTIPGATYDLSFSLGQYSAKPIYTGPVSVTAVAGLITNAVLTFTPTNGGANQWTNFQVTFTAQSGSTMITLTGLTAHGGQYLGLDNASLTNVNGGPQLLVNGGFEDINGQFTGSGDQSLPAHSTNIAGWVTTTAEIAWVTNSNPFGLSTPYGTMFLDLTGVHDSVPYGGVEQTVATSPGQNYTLSFALGVDQAQATFSGPVSVQAAIQNGSTFTTTAGGGNWQAFSFTFAANSSSTPISITGNSTFGGQYIGVDDVSVVSTAPAFVITSITPLNATNLVLDFNSQAGTNYAVQSTVDLTSGIWAYVRGTTNTGTGGVLGVTLTNAFGGAHQFYRIVQLP